MPALLPLSPSQQLGCEREAMMQHQREWFPPLPAALHISPSPGHVMGYDHSCAAPHQDLIPLLPPSLCPQIPTTRLFKTLVLALPTSLLPSKASECLLSSPSRSGVSLCFVPLSSPAALLLDLPFAIFRNSIKTKFREMSADPEYHVALSLGKEAFHSNMP